MHEHCSCHHHGHDSHSGHCHCHEHKGGLALWIRVFASLALALFGQFYLNESHFPWWANLLVMFTSYLVISYDVLFNMVRAIFKERRFFDESTLMILASIGAFSLRAFGPENNEYFEGVLVILLYQVGEHIQHSAEEKSRSSIRGALDLRHEVAQVKNGDAIKETRAEDLKIGDLVMLRAGSKCPCDGVVAHGEGLFDESSLTGEALPVEKQMGSKVFSGTLFLSGNALIRVEKEYRDSTVSKLLRLIEEGAQSKSKATKFLTRFSRVYTPIVMLLSLLVAIVPPLIMGANQPEYWQRFLYVALNFLVVSCPCAVVISVPLAYFAGLGLASKHGILVKGASFFDAANHLGLVAFDKTGTLTEGKLAVSEVVAFQDEKNFLRDFLIAETLSDHPIAQALRSYVGEEAHPAIEEAQDIPGKGTLVISNGHRYEAMNRPLKGEFACPSNPIGVISYLAVDGMDRGYIIFRDSLKEGARPSVSKLKERGIGTLLLSGDKEENVRRVAMETDIDRYRYELTPLGKSEELARELGAGKSVAFIGDGINDAPCLARADIGVTMGRFGSDLAITAADVLLMNDDPRTFVSFLDIAKKTERRAISCISLALIVKIGLMVASTVSAFMGTWSVPLFASVLGDTGVAFVCVLMAVSLFRSRKV